MPLTPLAFLSSSWSRRNCLSRGHGELVNAKTSTPDGPSDGLRAPFVAPELKRYADMQDLLLLDPVHDVDEKGWPNALAAPLPGTERRG